MDRLLAVFATLMDLGLVVAGFSLIIVIHELGHFLAARWAGIRVLAFALGFGPAVVSYRAGLGVRRGSSEPEYQRLRGAGAAAGAVVGPTGRPVSATEYRLNVLPMGGYVKMLGQDDADPSARSDESDSFQRCPAWKRMIVISAGVVCNVILAAVLFVVVFSAGLDTEPCKVGQVTPGSPAALAVASNAADLGVTQPGLKAGDEIVLIDGKVPDSFKDLSLAAAMARPGAAVAIEVRRRGVNEPLRFAVVPREDSFSRMLAIGVFPASSDTLLGVSPADGERGSIIKSFRARGLTAAEPGMRLVSVAGKTASETGGGLSVQDIDRAANEAGGEPIEVVFEGRGDNGAVVRAVEKVKGRPRLQDQAFALADKSNTIIGTQHLAGLMPLMRVAGVNAEGARSGLMAGDVLIKVGDVRWPSVPEAIGEIRRGNRTKVDLTVARPVEGGHAVVELPEVAVKGGVIGFDRDDTSALQAFVASYPRLAPGPGLFADKGDDKHAAMDVVLPENARVVSVNGVAVGTFIDIWKVLKSAAGASGGGPVEVTLGVQRGEVRVVEGEKKLIFTDAADVRMMLSKGDVEAVTGLTWTTTLSEWMFRPELIKLQGKNPLDSIAMGARETLRSMTSTYLTFARLFQGTVKVEHLKGPVGIAHVGTLLASKGFIWLLFFMAVVSVNLAVVNFLPLPIVDGGQFLFLVYEQITGKPVSIAVQNVAVIGGLLLIGSVFLITTFNDIANLLWR